MVNSVVLGTAAGADGKIAAPSSTFAPKDTIYAVVTTTITSPTSITARWTYQGGVLVHEDAQPLSTTGGNVTTVHISKPDGFPAGNYSLDIVNDGKSVSTTPFTVRNKRTGEISATSRNKNGRDNRALVL